jgi:predicted RNase H-like HicB family nuclease
MPSWRDELIEAVKSKAERDAEEAARHRKRVEEALATAETAMGLGVEALRYTRDKLKDKGQPVELAEEKDRYRVTLRDLSLTLELVRESAIIKVTFGEGKPRDFDLAKDRHIAPADVEEYMGRRSLELVRAAYKAQPW